MLPVPQNQRASRSPLAPERSDAARDRLFVERRATRRATPPGTARRRALNPQWLLAGAAPVLLVATFAVAGPLATVAVALALLLAAQAFAISALRARATRLDALSRTDELTGLGNSRALWTDLRELATTSPVALIMLDLDHFKRVNDEYGHPVGDALLRHAGRAARIVVGDLGRCYRYGGEELVAVLPGLDEELGCGVAERLRAIIVRPPNGLPPVTASAGVAVGSPGASAHHLVDRADRALRFAKANGRDRTVAATVAQDWAADREDSVVAARRAALAMASAALDARDPDTAEHSDEVVMLCEALADRLGIEGRDREHLLTAARLHDVGKVAVPHEILAKPSALDEAEWEIMREHTITGERILCSVPELAPVAPIVRHAHERYDGGGYPDGLAGESIPLASRVILCADAFHAIRSDRPYRAGRSVDEALQELLSNAGSQFDPSIATSLVSFVRDVRDETPALALRAAVRRSPRLLALVMAMVIGGTAFAAQRPLRHVLAGVIPGDSRTADTSRVAAGPATCATMTLQGTPCSAAAASFGPLVASVTRAPSPVATRPSRLGLSPAGHRPERFQVVTSGPETPAKTEARPSVPPVFAPDGAGDSVPRPPVPSRQDSPGAPVSGPSAPPIQYGPVVTVGDIPSPQDSPVVTTPTIAPGNSGVAPGHAPVAPGNSGYAPGHSPDGPGNSENAPGRQLDPQPAPVAVQTPAVTPEPVEAPSGNGDPQGKKPKPPKPPKAEKATKAPKGPKAR